MLTYCGLVMPYSDRDLVNIGSGNGLLPDGTKPLPEPILTDHQWSSVAFILGQFHKRCLNHQSLKSMKITYLKFPSNFPGANVLNLLAVVQRIQAKSAVMLPRIIVSCQTGPLGSCLTNHNEPDITLQGHVMLDVIGQCYSQTGWWLPHSKTA